MKSRGGVSESCDFKLNYQKELTRIHNYRFFPKNVPSVCVELWERIGKYLTLKMSHF